MMTADALFDWDPTGGARPRKFCDKVQAAMEEVCKDVKRASITSLDVIEPDERFAHWVTLARSEKNDDALHGWTINQLQRYEHRAIERGTGGRGPRAVMYALQDGDLIRVLPGDFLIAGYTLEEGRGGSSQHVLIPWNRWPLLHDYLANRA